MQTSFSNVPAVAFPGMPADNGPKDIVSRINAAKQLFSVEADTAENSADFVVTIDGTDYTYSSDSTATVAEIAAGLKALIEAGDADVTCTLFTTDTSNDSFYIENNSYDTEISVSITNPSSGVLILTELIDHDDAIHFGAVVSADDGNTVDSLTYKDDTCRLPRLAADVSSRRILGVALADVSKEVRSAAPYGGFSAGEAVPILRKGRVWMYVEDPANVAQGGLVYVRHVATGTEKLGDIRAADDAGDTDPLDRGVAQFTGQVDATNSLAVVAWNLSA